MARKVKKKKTEIRIFVMFVFTVTVAVFAYKFTITPEDQYIAKQEEEDHTVLMEKNSEEKIYPASLTKIMTAIDEYYVIY